MSTNEQIHCPVVVHLQTVLVLFRRLFRLCRAFKVWSEAPCFSSLPALSFQKLQEQDEHAEQLKGRLRWKQRELRVRLEQLQRGTERMRNDSQGSTMSSERSDSDRGRSRTRRVSPQASTHNNNKNKFEAILASATLIG